MSLSEAVRKEIDRRRNEFNLEADQEQSVSRSDVIDLALGLLFGRVPAGEDRELLAELVDVDAFVERTADHKGRVRLGGTGQGGREFLVVAVEDDGDG